MCVQGAADVPDKGVAKALAVARPVGCGLHIPACSMRGTQGGAHLVGFDSRLFPMPVPDHRLLAEPGKKQSPAMTVAAQMPCVTECSKCYRHVHCQCQHLCQNASPPAPADKPVFSTEPRAAAAHPEVTTRTSMTPSTESHTSAM
jgi:hypothetical protein